MVSAPLPAVRTKVPLARPEPLSPTHPVGTEGVIVAELGPDVFLVELRILDDALVGGAWYQVFEMREDEFERVT